MMRFNLQLFAQKLNTGTSIVDYLKSQGQDSSMSARKELAKSLGITNYSGSYDQNVQMLKALQSSSATNSVSGNTGGGSQKVALTGGTDSGSGGNSGTKLVQTGGSNSGGASNTGSASIKGVAQSTIDKIGSTFQASDKVTGANAEAQGYLGKVQELAGVTDIVDQSTWDILNTPYQTPTAVTEAFNYTNQLLQQLSSGRTSYTDQIKALMGDIQSRDKFTYDVDSDPLFQQALASAMSSGKTAMQDTIGQASSLTGGYASTYATSAGNQAYNAYIQDAYANLPAYYEMALEAYQMEGQEMYQQLAMLSDADATEYQRMYDSWSANFSNAQQMYQNSYGEWQDTINNAYNSANLQINEHGQIVDQVYNAYNATANNAQQMYQNEYNAWADEVANAVKIASMANSDYWSGEELTQRQNEFDTEMEYKRDALAQDDSQFYASLGQDQSQFDASMAQEQAQFISRYDLNGDGIVDSQDQAVEASASGSSDFATLTNSDMKTLEEVYISAGGGTAGLEAVDRQLTLLGKNNLSEEANDALTETLNGVDMPLQHQDWTIADDTKNRGFLWWKGVDHNDTYTYNGTTKTYDQLSEMIDLSDMSEAEKEQMRKALQNQSKK